MVHFLLRKRREKSLLHLQIKVSCAQLRSQHSVEGAGSRQWDYLYFVKQGSEVSQKLGIIQLTFCVYISSEVP